MLRIFNTSMDSIAWVFTTGWDIWSSLFSALPYGDPYIATVVALMVFYTALKTCYPGARIY